MPVAFDKHAIVQKLVEIAHTVLRRALDPGKGDFSVSNFHPGPISENLGETIFGCEGDCSRGRGGLFLGVPPWKKLLAG
jgi:hypothetical protein